MALLHHLHPALVVLLLGLAISGFDISTSQLVKGNISCLDCSSHYDFSGTMIGIKCANVKKLATTTTNSDGSFEVELPTTSNSNSSPLNCLAKIMGGTTQIYSTNKNMFSNVVKSNYGSNSFTISTPLAFTKSQRHGHNIDESKTIDLPLPKEWGLAPSSYYVPFIPIIGIP